MRLPRRASAFTLPELLVVIATIAVIAGLIAPAVSRGRKKSTTAKCAEQLRQLGLAMTLYQDDHNSLLPPAHALVPWSSTNPVAWTRPLSLYYDTTNVLRCPEFSRLFNQCPFSYFMGSRAAFIEAGGQAAGLVWTRIRFPSNYILSGDCNIPFQRDDADPDNYTQDTLFASNSIAHCGKVNILFADGHLQTTRRFEPGSMTYSYTQPGVNWSF